MSKVKTKKTKTKKAKSEKSIPINRHARLIGTSKWFAYGAVTITQAAEKHAAEIDAGSTLGSTFIEVCCESNPKKIYQLHVERATTWAVTNPRQGA